MRRVFLLPALLFLVVSLSAQVDEELYFEIIENSGADEDAVTNAMEQLSGQSSGLLNLNTADSDLLEQLLLVSHEQAMDLVFYRDSWPPVLCINELFLLDSWDSATIYRIAPFVTTPFEQPVDSITRDDLFQYADHKLLLRFSGKAPGKAEDTVSRYDGNQQKILFKYSYNADDRIFAGLVAEKDPGEPFSFETGRRGFDYYAGYLLFKGRKFIDEAVVGDYNLQFGQGLTFWSGFALSSGVEMTSGRRIPLNIRRHSGTEENDFLRGAACSIKYKRIKTTIFGSAHRRDANMTMTDSVNGQNYYTGFKSGGYHRNGDELDEKNNLKEYLAGGNMNLSFGNLKLGATVCLQKIDGCIEEKTGASDWYKFHGNQNLNIGVDFVGAMKKLIFYGEAAMSANGAKAIVFGADLFPDTRINYSLHIRSVEADFHNLHSNIFRLSSGANQQGIYQSVLLHLGNGFSFSGYLDFNRTFANKTGCHKPLSEVRSSWRLNYAYKRDVKAYLQGTYKCYDDDNGTVNNFTWNTIRESVWSGRLHFIFDVSGIFRIQHRLAYTCAGDGSGDGFLSYLDLRIHQIRLPVTLSLRYTQFETDGFSSRIYSYESDVLYSFSVPAYYDSGKSVYLCFSWKPVRRVTIYGRASMLFNPEKDRIIDKKFAVQPGYSLQLRVSL